MGKITFGIATRIDTIERRSYLEECINSIKAQTQSDWEIVISNDCSPIDVPWLEYQKDSRIRIFHQPQSLGIFGNFNFILRQVTTEFFIPMGDDDLVYPDFVQKTLRCFDTHRDKHIDLLYFNYDNITASGKVFYTSRLEESFFEKGIDTLNLNIQDFFAGEKIIRLFCAVVRTQSLKNIGGFPQEFIILTDVYLLWHYSLLFNMYAMSDCMVQIRHHANNFSGIKKIDLLHDEWLYFVELINNRFLSHMNETNKKKVLDYVLSLETNEIALLKQFKRNSRGDGIRFFFSHKKTLKHYLIFVLGLVFGKRVHSSFTFVFLVYSKFKDIF